MKKIYLLACGLAFASATVQGQVTSFPGQLNTVNWGTTSVQMPASPLRTQVIFIGGHDTVAHKAINNGAAGNFSAGFAPAKQWHDYIGFTQDTAVGTQDLGWVSVNHETVFKDDKLGDGGGMTVFKVRRITVPGGVDSIVVVPQNLSSNGFPNVSTKFFSVDFKGTVGETGMNCGGITNYNDGRVWTAEEWFRTSTSSIFTAQNAAFSAAGSLPMVDSGTSVVGQGVRDTADFTINVPGNPFGFNGQSIKKWQNFNFMVEIDPRTGAAIRKQYNWGRSGWEGGIVAADNRTVYMGDDATPGLFVKFVANTAGDFTSGDLYFHRYNPADPNGLNPNSHWRKISNNNLDTMLNLNNYAKQIGATVFDRVEWVTMDRSTGIVYFTETGNDNVNLSSFPNAVISPHTRAAYRARYQERFGVAFTGNDSLVDAYMKGSNDALRFKDYYGRITKYDPSTGLVSTHLEAGPYFAASPSVANYPSKHLTNPDGLGYMFVGGRHWLVINEDLNGRTFGRTPSEFQSSGNSFCEMFLLDLAIQNPTVNDLVRLAVTPFGAEITGGKASFDGKTLFFNSQHPSKGNPFPYNNSMTLAISGLEGAILGGLLDERPSFNGNSFQVWPNPVARELHLNKAQDVAIYNAQGQRMEVYRNVERIDMFDFTPGVYFIRNAEGQTQKLIVE